ncbi:MAG: hypothetical protein RL069_1605, partial [Planctomycetota bacterium]
KPREILDEARDDARAKRYSLALAKHVWFHKNALIKTKEYETYAKYIRGTSDFFAIKDTYEQGKKSADRMRDQGKSLLEHLDKTFRHETATLVAVLVNVDRKDEANEIADIAEEFIDDEKFLVSLKAAREGTVPAPWP